jgi:hypothetical protein
MIPLFLLGGPLILAGLPDTIAEEGTFFVTTLPAMTMALSPMSIPAMITEPAPIKAPLPTFVTGYFPDGTRFYYSRRRIHFAGRGMTGN